MVVQRDGGGMEKDRQVGEKRPSAVVFETMDATGASKGQVRGK